MRHLPLLVIALLAPALHAGVDMTHGPVVGHVNSTSARIWCRWDDDGHHDLHLVEYDTGGKARSVKGEALAAHDYCITFLARGLQPGTRYEYWFDAGPRNKDAYTFITPLPPDEAAHVSLCFGSCANEKDVTAAVWDRINDTRPDAMVLLGDTPYIDTTDLARQRLRYAAFSGVESFQSLASHTPVYGTWDDHDFGRNDTDGRLPGKERSRQAFTEYRPNPSFGDGTHGIYTSFRRGPMEVFLLDTRYFAATEASPVNPDKTTLLGAGQWQWLLDALENSTATFKVLACGMIWNGSVRPTKTDHWGTYLHEQEALFSFIGDRRIGGVVLVGGDIHRSRSLLHNTTAEAGYAIPEFISSPMHDSIISAANQPHPALLKDIGRGQIFLNLEADTLGSTPSLAATFIHADGTVPYSVTYSLKDLSPIFPDEKPRVLVFSRTAGFRHGSIPEGIAAISGLGEGYFAVDATEDPGAFTTGNLKQYAGVVFLNTTGDVLNNAQQAAYESYIGDGGGYIGVHAAADTEYGWTWYGELVGAWFRTHPRIQQATIRVEDHNHPSTRHLPEEWIRTDEWYVYRASPRSSVRVLASLDESTYSGGGMDGDHPITWCHDFSGGRAWYTGGGHTKESYTEPAFLTHLLGGILWASGLVDDAPPAPGS